MNTRHIGRIVTGCLISGPIAAAALVLGPVAGAKEPVITGTILLAFAASWASLATFSRRWTDQPQRWAFAPAAFMGVAGGALLLFAPNGAVIDALGWVWPPLFLALLTATAASVHRQLQSRSRVWLVYPLLGVYALCALGGAYETIREALDRRIAAPGQMVEIRGHRLHLRCAGSGTPTVLLESGLGETSAYWGWIAPAIARDTRVCAYDRPGRGWSDPVPVAQDVGTVAADLHTLLDRADVPAPFVLVGHSSGAQYVRIFAGRYPNQVVGMVLLDGQPAEAFEGLPSYPTFYRLFHRIAAVLPTLARVGVGRLLVHPYADLPAPARELQRIHYASAQFYLSLRDELEALPASLAHAKSTPSLGSRPLVVVTAAEEAQAGWLALQDGLARLSTNSSHRVVACTHMALVTQQAAAQMSIQAIRDVVRAVRSNVALPKSL